MDRAKVLDAIGQEINKGDIIGIAESNYIRKVVVKKITPRSIQFYTLYPDTEDIYPGYINSIRSKRLIRIDPASIVDEGYKSSYSEIMNLMKEI